MPTLTAGDKVLVIGANGFIAAWVVRKFLEKGYAVRGSVRSADKGTFLQESFKSYGDKFEIVVVEDFTKEGAFDEAVQGVHGIAHTASPAYLDAVSVEEMIGPAVGGTVGVLKSAAKHGQSVKRIVLTSSVGAIFEGEDKVVTEEQWNEAAIKQIKEQGDNAPGFIKYLASKTLAEKAAWKYYEENKSHLNWDLSVLHPPMVFGPVIHDVNKVENLPTTPRIWYDAVLVDGELPTIGTSWVDVRDVGEAHVLALEKEAAGGERIIICEGSYVWQDWLDAANSLSPSPIPSHSSLPKGNPGAGRNVKPFAPCDTSKAKRIIGLKYRTKEETTRDILADFERRGW